MCVARQSCLRRSTTMYRSRNCLLLPLGVWLFHTAFAAVAVVHTSTGTVRGFWANSHFGDNPYVAFRGIPYAQPPVGPLRFRPPQPVRPWTNIRDCLEHGSVCLQAANANYTGGGGGVMGAEDCLTLNVYTPDTNQRRAVMVFIHGGGFYLGSGNSDLHGPDFLIDQGVVVVTMNYRLGLLGFLALNASSAITGNQGLKDQQLALRWIRENAQVFGGDPERITLFGFSAGSLSVQLHMLAPGSKGLFQNAILMSTAFDARNVFRPADAAIAKKVRSFLEQFSTQLVTQADVERELMAVAAERFVLDWPFVRFAPHLPLPTMEHAQAPQPFMQGPAERYALEDDFNVTINTLVGHASNEGILLGSRRQFDDFRANLQYDIPTFHFDRNFSSPVYLHAADEITHRYFPNGLTEHSWNDYILLMSHIYQTYPALQTVRRLAARSTGRTYHYRFDLDTRLNYAKRWTGARVYADQLPGASHGDEMCYVFYCEALYPGMYDGVTKGTVEYGFVHEMSDIFGSFAKRGRVYWREAIVGEVNYLFMRMTGFAERTHGFLRDGAFWDGIVSRVSAKEPLIQAYILKILALTSSFLRQII